MAQQALLNPWWLTLDQASKRLGVHPTTLRRWANEGAIEVFVTPGGHRRFSSEALDRFAKEHQRTNLPARQPAWADHAIAHARENLREQRWVVGYDESERENQRYLGRRLMGLVLQFVAHPGEDPGLMAEARIIGVQHAQNAMKNGRTLQDLLNALSFFRVTLLEAVLLEIPRSGRIRTEADAHLLHRIERLVGEVQAGVVELYLGENK
jgi:excisionase family DNA binding protein